MRIKDIGNINARVLRENTPQDYTFQYIDISSVSSDGQISLSEPMRYDESPSRARRIVKKDDVIVSTVRTYLRAIAGIDWDAKDTIASTGFAVISPDKKNDPAYVKYLMSSDAVVDEIYKESTGVSYPAISSSRLSAIQIPVVSLKEQKTISAYLDKQINSINERIWLRERELQILIKLKQSEINSVVTRGLDATVPMKDSGIDWIGQIPAHWDVKRMKEIGNIQLGKMLKNNPEDGDQLKPYLKSKNIQWLELNMDTVEEMWFSELEMSRLRLRPGDLLYSEGGEVGKCAIWNGELEECYIQNSVHKFTLHQGNNPRYYLYLSYHLGTVGYFNSIVNLVSIKHLTGEKIRQIVLPVPPPEEQNAIADYIDSEFKTIDSMIGNISEQIDKLRLLKKALINEVIMGKRAIE